MSVPFTGLDAELFADCGLAEAVHVGLTVKGDNAVSFTDDVCENEDEAIHGEHRGG